MEHNRDAAPLLPPYPRESGTLVRVTDDGRELRLHGIAQGRPLAHYWSVDHLGRPVCAVAWGLTPDEWRAAGEAVADSMAGPAAVDEASR